ncbi:hypothetical protein B6U81_06010 [Thermoplasmatales archaeon ex4484_30]|nr:MAG: hypothetical protein B6U81_06010 [Thermoplasmatales archaeon ex4484_30]
MLKGFDVDVADGGKKALRLLGANEYFAVILDLKMPDMPGIEILRWAHNKNMDTQFIIVTGYGEIESAVEAMKLGAVDYIQKPFEPEELIILLNKIGKEKTKPALKDYVKGNVLLVTDINPEDFKRKYGISANESIWLKKTTPANVINVMEKFAGTVIHSGIKYLLNTYGRKETVNYLHKIYEITRNKPLSLIMAYGSAEERILLNEIQAILPIEELLGACKNAIRRGILQLLYNHPLTYTQIMKELKIRHSSKLAFHLKKLIEKELIEKKNKFYSLTTRGASLVKMLDSVLSNINGRITYFQL